MFLLIPEWPKPHINVTYLPLQPHRKLFFPLCGSMHYAKGSHEPFQSFQVYLVGRMEVKAAEVGYIQQTTSEFPSLVPQPAAFIPWRIFSYLTKRLWDSSRSMSLSKEIHWRGPAVWSAVPHGWGFTKPRELKMLKRLAAIWVLFLF